MKLVLASNLKMTPRMTFRMTFKILDFRGVSNEDFEGGLVVKLRSRSGPGLVKVWSRSVPGLVQHRLSQS